MNRRRITKWFETDAYSKWGRKHLCYIQRAGVRKGIKRMTHRRERLEGRAEINDQLNDN